LRVSFSRSRDGAASGADRSGWWRSWSSLERCETHRARPSEPRRRRGENCAGERLHRDAAAVDDVLPCAASTAAVGSLPRSTAREVRPCLCVCAAYVIQARSTELVNALSKADADGSSLLDPLPGLESAGGTMPRRAGSGQDGPATASYRRQCLKRLPPVQTDWKDTSAECWIKMRPRPEPYSQGGVVEAA